MLHKIVTDANGEVIDGNKEWRNKYAQDSSGIEIAGDEEHCSKRIAKLF